MTRLTRCDICAHEIPAGRGEGYRLEKIDNPLSSPDAHGYYDVCSNACLCTLANTLTDREKEPLR